MSDQPAILRIFDANLNRAREGLRVVEEYARFVLEDAALSESLKSLRHDLVMAIPKGIGIALHAHRDSRRDVGRKLPNPSDNQRGSAGEVARASAARVGEALRCIEEYAKTCDTAFAERMSTLRYRMYELEKRFFLTAALPHRFGHVRLYVILTEALCRRDWLETARLAIEGGADAIQLREKDLSDEDLVIRARRLAALCRDRGATFIVNDRPDIAMLCAADGVHVGQEDLPVADVRRILPASMIVGVSTHTLQQIDAATADAPDYVAVGPMFPTATKPQEHIAGLATLAYARKQASIPLVAIGGITSQNAAQILNTAPCALCVCSAVISVDDPAAATRQLKAVTNVAQKSRAT